MEHLGEPGLEALTMTKPLFRGVCASTATPFTADGRPDLPRLGPQLEPEHCRRLAVILRDLGYRVEDRA